MTEFVRVEEFAVRQTPLCPSLVTEAYGVKMRFEDGAFHVACAVTPAMKALVVDIANQLGPLVRGGMSIREAEELVLGGGRNV